MKDVRFLTLVGATGTIRTAQFDGRDHVVVPVIALVEGVIHPVNAPTPELVRADQFINLSAWNGRPVFAGHPTKNGVPVSGNHPEILASAFGQVFNASVDGTKLRMEAWLDPSRIKPDTAPLRVLERVQAGEMVEVSVGVYVNAQATPGEWKGRKYKAEWKGMIPDHLALLGDGQTGACSIAMGCGTPRAAMMRVAEGGELEPIVNEEPEMDKGLFSRFLSFFRAAQPRGWGDDEVKQELRDELDALEPTMGKGGDIVRVTNDTVTYVLWPMMGGDQYAPKMQWYQRSYSFDAATQKFNVSLERKEVEPTTVYAPVTYAEGSPVQDLPESTPKAPCACGNHAAAAAGEDNMERKDRIAALMSNPHGTIKSLKMLEAATDDELKALEDQAAGAATLKAAADKAAADKAIADKAEADRKAKEGEDLKTAQARADAAEAALKVAQGNQVTDAMRALVSKEEKREADEKSAIVAKLKVAQQAFSEEQLAAKGIDELKQLAMLVKVEAPRDYSGQGIPRVAAAPAGSNFAPPDPYASLTAK